MRRRMPLFLLLAGIAAAQEPVPRAQEPVIGGPCEGCELVFVGRPGAPASTARIAPEGEPGQPLVLEGTVRTLAGQPAPGTVVYAYHTDAKGLYPRGATRHGSLRGWAVAGPRGEFTFRTIRPGAYPGRRIPQHVHFHVIEPGRGTYYIDDLVFDDDPILTAEQRGRLVRERGGSGLGRPVKGADGVWHVRRDIVLGKNVPAYGSLAAR